MMKVNQNEKKLFQMIGQILKLLEMGGTPGTFLVLPLLFCQFLAKIRQFLRDFFKI